MMHKATFKVRYVLEGEMTVGTTDIGKAKDEVARLVMRGMSVSGELSGTMPAQMRVEVELKESQVLPSIALVNQVRIRDNGAAVG